MLLHDTALHQAIQNGNLDITPFVPQAVQPSSIDVQLDGHFAIIATDDRKDMDVRQNNSERVHRVYVEPGDYFLLRPEHFVLASTVERIRIGNGYAARVEGKSSLGRLGLMVHATAGFIDPGFEGTITFELRNLLDVPMRLYPGMAIAQLCVFLMSGPAKVPYSAIGKYVGQTGPTPSQYHRNFMTSASDDPNNVRIV